MVVALRNCAFWEEDITAAAYPVKFVSGYIMLGTLERLLVCSVKRAKNRENFTNVERLTTSSRGGNSTQAY